MSDQRLKRPAESQPVPRSSSVSFSGFSGPLPPPEILLQYKQTSPEIVDLILRNAEKQTEHRHGLERDALNAQIYEMKAGLWLGWSVAMVLALSMILAGWKGQTGAAFVLGGVNLTWLATTAAAAFRRRKRTTDADRPSG